MFCAYILLVPCRKFGTSTIAPDSHAKNIEQKGMKSLQEIRHVITKLKVFPDHMAQVYFCDDSGAMQKCIFKKKMSFLDPEILSLRCMLPT